MDNKRNRYQNGSLTIEKRKTGPAVWVFRWREHGRDGTSSRRKRLIGSKADFPTRTSALKEVGSWQLDINQDVVNSGPATLSDLVDHYRSKELTASAAKTARTVAVYEQHLRDFVLPRWGSSRLDSIKAPQVEAWLLTLQLAPATKAKTRNIMSSLFQHAMRYSWANSNPIRLVRQSSKKTD